MESKATKWCATCNDGAGAFKTLDKFWRNKRRYDGLQTHCIECQKKYDRDNPEQRRRRSRKCADKLKPLVGYAGQKGQKAVEAFIAGEEVRLPGDGEADEILRKFLDGGIQRVDG